MRWVAQAARARNT